MKLPDEIRSADASLLRHVVLIDFANRQKAAMETPELPAGDEEPDF